MHRRVALAAAGNLTEYSRQTEYIPFVGSPTPPPTPHPRCMLTKLHPPCLPPPFPPSVVSKFGLANERPRVQHETTPPFV